jgi:hypothetical protein
MSVTSATVILVLCVLESHTNWNENFKLRRYVFRCRDKTGRGMLDLQTWVEHKICEIPSQQRMGMCSISNKQEVCKNIIWGRKSERMH